MAQYLFLDKPPKEVEGRVLCHPFIGILDVLPGTY